MKRPSIGRFKASFTDSDSVNRGSNPRLPASIYGASGVKPFLLGIYESLGHHQLGDTLDEPGTQSGDSSISAGKREL